MSESKIEEIIFLLALIICLIAYYLGINWLFWVFAVKSALDLMAVFYFIGKEFKKEFKKN